MRSERAITRLVIAVLLMVGCKGDAPKPAAEAPKRAGFFRVDPATDPSQPPALVLVTTRVKGAAPDDLDPTRYKVVMNHEEQYSIWPDRRENPLGWVDVGKAGTKQECLDYIKEVWTDMRPLSLRKKAEEPEADQPTTP